MTEISLIQAVNLALARAMQDDDTATPGMLAVLDKGLATPEHAAFVARLEAIRDQSQGQGPA